MSLVSHSLSLDGTDVFFVVSVDILKPDTGYLSVIERPSTIVSPKTATSRQPSSEGSYSPDDVASYTEPLSEGEDDDYNAALAPAKDEGKRAGLSGDEVNAAIAFREQMLKERKEEEEAQKKTAEESKSVGKAKEPVANGAEADEQEDHPHKQHHRRPKYRRDKSTLGRKIKGKNLDIDPLAPSSTFDETLKSKLGSAEAAQQKREANGGSERPDIQEEQAALGGPSRIGDDRILDRSWRAPSGKRIAVPVRIEPKVYFAAERTFLVSVIFVCFVLGSLFFLAIYRHCVRGKDGWLGCVRTPTFSVCALVPCFSNTSNGTYSVVALNCFWMTY
jgi:hypothetical protein